MHSSLVNTNLHSLLIGGLVAAECSQHTSDILRSLLLNEERLSAEAQLILCLAAYALGLADSKRLQSFSVDDILKCLKYVSATNA